MTDEQIAKQVLAIQDTLTKRHGPYGVVATFQASQNLQAIEQHFSTEEAVAILEALYLLLGVVMPQPEQPTITLHGMN